MKILVTGGCGFVGANICIYLKKLGFNILWKYKGVNEIGIDSKTKKTIIKVDKKFFRPGEVDFLKGDFSKAKNLLKWKPSYNIHQLIDDMIYHELKINE